MKRISICIAMLLACALLFGCTAKASDEVKEELAAAVEELNVLLEEQSKEKEEPVDADNPQAALAAIYTYIGNYVDGTYVVNPDQITYCVTLRADGTGALYWGEDNKGDFEKWTLDEDGTITLYAGVSEIKGTCKDGILLLDLDDGLIVGWGSSEVDFGALNYITLEDYLTQQAQDSVETLAPYAGIYKLFCYHMGEYYVVSPDESAQVTISLYDNATGEVVQSEGGSGLFGWYADGQTIMIYDVTTADAQALGTVENGILIVPMQTENDDGTVTTQGEVIYATETADTSAFETITSEEYVNILIAE